MKLIVLTLLTILAFVSAAPQGVAAQTDKPKCDAASVIATANTLKASGDSKADTALLLKLRDQIEAVNIACNGMTYTGQGNKSVGPVTLATGAYLVTIKGKVRHVDGSLTLKSLKGDCGFMWLQVMPEGGTDMLSSDWKDAEASQTLQVTDCRAMFETSFISGWILTIEPLE